MNNAYNKVTVIESAENSDEETAQKKKFKFGDGIRAAVQKVKEKIDEKKQSIDEKKQNKIKTRSLADSELQVSFTNQSVNNSEEESKNPFNPQDETTSRDSQITDKKKYKFGDGIRSIKDKIKNKIDEKKDK